MGQAAAFFDLDRTLLASASAPVLHAELVKAGLVSERRVPGSPALVGLYNRFGETTPAMLIARAAVLGSRGHATADVAAAAETAGEILEQLIAPRARTLIEEQRSKGRALVMATTTPAHLVTPLALRLGFDDVVATRYGTYVGDDGVRRFNGRLDGGFVWGAGKLLAVRRWASKAGIRLKDCAVFSDSIYDVGLLAAVGEACAVNPDIRLAPIAHLRRWPIVHLEAPPGVPKVLGVEPLDLVRLALPHIAAPFARFEISGLDNIAPSGPVIVAANHRSYFDPVAYGLAVLGAGRYPRGMAKKELFDAPVVGPLLRAGGAICVDRDGNARNAYHQAEDALRAGEAVLIAPQGTIPRGSAFFDPELVGKTGAARLAAATGAPVVPLGLWGTEAVWPRSTRLPKVPVLGRQPTVSVRVGKPITGLTGRDAEADTRRIMAAISELLPLEARRRREPSPDELASTFPA